MMENNAARPGLADLNDIAVEPASIAVAGGVDYALGWTVEDRKLVVLARGAAAIPDGFEGTTSAYGDGTLLVGPCSARNAAALRAQLAWLTPQPLGLRLSAGLGDRLGLATPGHVRAVRSAGGDIAPIFAQQSIREMARTNRTPQDVIDDALWGVFAEGWRDAWGAVADHLKTPADIYACVAAGYTFFTVDPGEHVDNAAETADEAALRAAHAALPWAQLEDTPADQLRRYAGRTYAVEGAQIACDEQTTLRAAVKYGRAVAHVAAMARHLLARTGGEGCELEISVDETELPTRHAEHIFIASELQRLGVRWVSLAPRYVGRFEKGVDYLGNLEAFERDFAVHAAIARQWGPYKLSLHSGSDKWSVYPVAARQTRGQVHLKTAGTSYLEALHTVAQLDPALFRAIYTFARERYPVDRATYHVSADLDRAPLPDAVAGEDLPLLLDQFDARQILHVTFGSVLTARTGDGRSQFGERIMALLRANPETYAANLEAHFLRHLRPFADARRDSADARLV
jgi:hypothetical protein